MLGTARRTRRRRVIGLVLAAAGTLVLAVSGYEFGNHLWGHGHAGPVLAEHSVPPALLPVSRPPAIPPGTPASTPASAPPAVVPDRPGLPVRVIVPSHGVDAQVIAHPVEPDGNVYVPRDPREVAWASGDGHLPYSAPGNSHGTAILVSHINYGGVAGAFSDLASYRIGQRITVVLADGRQLVYAVSAAPISVSKQRLAADLRVAGTPLHHQIFDQSGSYHADGGPLSGRLLLASCGGSFDNSSGNYEDNVFVFALPVS